MRGFDLIYLFSLVDSILRGARLAMWCTCLIDRRFLEPSVTHLYLFWPRMSQTFYGLVVPQLRAPGRSGPFFLQSLHSSLESKLLVSHFFQDLFKTTSQGRLIKTIFRKL